MSPIFLVLNASRPPQIAWGWGRLGFPTCLESDKEVPADGSGDSGTQRDEGGRNFSTAEKNIQPAPPLGWEQE